MVSETKLDDTFPTSELLMQGFSTPFRNDRTTKGVTYFYTSEKISLAK